MFITKEDYNIKVWTPQKNGGWEQQVKWKVWSSLKRNNNKNILILKKGPRARKGLGDQSSS